MAEQYLRQSPLAHLRLAARANSQTAETTSEAEICLGERTFHQQWVLRGNAEDEQFMAAVRGVTGCDLPVLPNTVHVEGNISALWLGPDEWLLVTPNDGTTRQYNSPPISKPGTCGPGAVHLTCIQAVLP